MNDGPANAGGVYFVSCPDCQRSTSGRCAQHRNVVVSVFNTIGVPADAAIPFVTIPLLPSTTAGGVYS